eukprot:9708665-Lingulodinium_polyedra.AAC.1
MPKQRSVPKMIEVESGELATTAVQCRQRWQRFFAGKLCGRIQSFEKLLEDSIEQQRSARHSISELQRDLVITRRSLALRLAKPKKGRAHGEDCIPAELLA